MRQSHSLTRIICRHAALVKPLVDVQTARARVFAVVPFILMQSRHRAWLRASQVRSQFIDPRTPTLAQLPALKPTIPRADSQSTWERGLTPLAVAKHRYNDAAT